MGFFNGEYYHIYNRGTEGRKVFLDGADYFRFLLGLYGFNDTKSIFHLERYDQLKAKEKMDPPKEPLVEIACYCLMPNHYHFILSQIRDGGIPEFMKKLGIGYTKYFNKRYQRNGVLFQGGYKNKHINSDEYLLHLSRYIHLNPLSLIQKDWKEKGIINGKDALKFLISYKWHSLPFLLENRPNILKLKSDIILNQFKSLCDYSEFIMKWTGSEIVRISNLIIEKDLD